MVRKLLIVLSLLALLAVSACSPTPDRATDIKLAKADNGKTITLIKGSTVELTLEGNPTTGYMWGLLPTTQNDLIMKADADYQFKVDNPNLSGSGGKFIFKFQAANPGKAVLHFGYQRSWETNVAPIEIFDVTFNIKDTR